MVFAQDPRDFLVNLERLSPEPRMRRLTTGRLALASVVVLASAAGPPTTGTVSPKQPVTLSGTALVLADALKSLGVVADVEPIAGQVVLRGDDGVITPLLSDDASRALFKDERLRRRRLEVNGLRRPGIPYLQVVSFQIEDEGRLRTPEYYCEICTISVRFPQICPCCQGDMVLRMKPESR